MSLFRVLVFLIIPILLMPITSDAKQRITAGGKTVVVDSFRVVEDQFEITYNGRVLKGPADQLSAVITAITIHEQENNRNQEVPERRGSVAEQRQGKSHRVSQKKKTERIHGKRPIYKYRKGIELGMTKSELAKLYALTPYGQSEFGSDTYLIENPEEVEKKVSKIKITVDERNIVYEIYVVYERGYILYDLGPNLTILEGVYGKSNAKSGYHYIPIGTGGISPVGCWQEGNYSLKCSKFQDPYQTMTKQIFLTYTNVSIKDKIEKAYDRRLGEKIQKDRDQKIQAWD